MALESANYIAGLVESNPTGQDDKTTADDHLRLIKAVLKLTFPKADGPHIATDTEINYLTGLTANVQQTLTDLGNAIVANTAAVSALQTSLSRVKRGQVNSDGNYVVIPSGWSSAKNSTGIYEVVHNLGIPETSYGVLAQPIGPNINYGTFIKTDHSFAVAFLTTSLVPHDAAFDFQLVIY